MVLKKVSNWFITLVIQKVMKSYEVKQISSILSHF